MDRLTIRCEQCKHGSMVKVEGEMLPMCNLSRRFIWACLTGKDDRFVKKENKDGE